MNVGFWPLADVRFRLKPDIYIARGPQRLIAIGLRCLTSKARQDINAGLFDVTKKLL